MPETHGERARGLHGGPSDEAASGADAPRRPPALAPNVRRHIGLSLRTFYPADPAEPLGERIEALLIRLGRTP